MPFFGKDYACLDCVWRSSSFDEPSTQKGCQKCRRVQQFVDARKSGDRGLKYLTDAIDYGRRTSLLGFFEWFVEMHGDPWVDKNYLKAELRFYLDRPRKTDMKEILGRALASTLIIVQTRLYHDTSDLFIPLPSSFSGGLLAGTILYEEQWDAVICAQETVVEESKKNMLDHLETPGDPLRKAIENADLYRIWIDEKTHLFKLKSF